MDANAKKQALIEKLEAEKIRMQDFGGRQKMVRGIDLAIEYLKTGKYSKSDVSEYDHLEGVVEDLETMYLDYNVD